MRRPVGNERVPDGRLHPVDRPLGRLQFDRRPVVVERGHQNDVVVVVVLGRVGRNARRRRQAPHALAPRRRRRLPTERVQVVQVGRHEHRPQHAVDLVDDVLGVLNRPEADGLHVASCL